MKKSYFIEMAVNIFDLEAQVQGSIHQGYIPQGGPFMAESFICQAMILDNKVELQLVSPLDQEHPIEDYFKEYPEDNYPPDYNPPQS